MWIWAITGGVACGKSTVCRLFAECGAVIYSADADAQETRELPEVQTRILAALGTLEKAELARIIYSNETKRKELGAILHPYIREKMQKVIQQARESEKPGLVLYEVPLLFEGGLETWFDGVIAVIASPEVQKVRLQARERERGRPELTPTEIEKRLATQYVIATDVSLSQTEKQVQDVYREIVGAVATWD
jgi:dephospho-CoA kinase